LESWWITAKPELVCPGDFCARSSLPDGRADFVAVLSGYSNSGFAIEVSYLTKYTLVGYGDFFIIYFPGSRAEKLVEQDHLIDCATEKGNYLQCWWRRLDE
jgi:hypothetical protein